MRETEFWARLELALGSTYAPFWAGQTVLRGLSGRTAGEALAAGVPPKEVWREVHDFLDLPASER